MKFIKNLSNSEAKYKYFSLSIEAREEFPETDKFFDLKFKNKTFQIWVNKKNCFMISKLYDDYEFQEGDEVKVIKDKKGNFELTVKK